MHMHIHHAHARRHRSHARADIGHTIQALHSTSCHTGETLIIPNRHYTAQAQPIASQLHVGRLRHHGWRRTHEQPYAHGTDAWSPRPTTSSSSQRRRQTTAAAIAAAAAAAATAAAAAAFTAAIKAATSLPRHEVDDSKARSQSMKPVHEHRARGRHARAQQCQV